MKKLLVMAATMLATQVGFAKLHITTTVDHEIVKTVEIEELETVELPFNKAEMNLGDSTEDLLRRITEGTLDLADVVNIYAKAWQIIKENKPILKARTKRASALPRGLHRWDSLSGWSPPRATTYRVKYKNLYGINVVVLEYRLVHSYGGGIEGRGKYITNATIQYQKVDVMWGFIFSADVEVPQVLNLGTRENPVAGMEITLNWDIRTRPIMVKKGKYSSSFFVFGDGRATRVLN